MVLLCLPLQSSFLLPPVLGRGTDYSQITGAAFAYGVHPTGMFPDPDVLS